MVYISWISDTAANLVHVFEPLVHQMVINKCFIYILLCVTHAHTYTTQQYINTCLGHSCFIKLLDPKYKYKFCSFFFAIIGLLKVFEKHPFTYYRFTADCVNIDISDKPHFQLKWSDPALDAVSLFCYCSALSMDCIPHFPCVTWTH